MPRAALIVLAVLVALAGCGEERRTIESSRIPFTFEVPKDFKRVPVRPGSSQGTPPLLAVGRDRFNLIDVRQSAPKELPLGTVERQVGASLAQLGFSDEKAEREKHAGRDMAVFEVDNRIRARATRSKLYFFTGGGRTWELECQSTESGRDELQSACGDALDSIDFQD